MGKTINITVAKTNHILRRIRRWGDPVMKSWGFDYNLISTSNFQAVRTYNDGNFTWGAVTNFLRIPHIEVRELLNMQFPERTDAGYFDRYSKMEWLCSYRGSMYMYENQSDDWKIAPSIRWGTVALGGNLVQVERYEKIYTSISGEPKRYYEMARLVGFRPTDWARPLKDLLASGLVHRCYCVYKNNGFGDTPKGIIYSPFFSPLDYDFAGTSKPKALYLPVMWFED